MEKYILQILENNSRVIVPEFGAFIIKQKNPLIIVFNEFLQYNDGVLVDTVAKNEGTDRDSAKKKIDEFVKDINKQLDKGDPYIIAQLGALIKSSTGKISLEKESAGKTNKAAETKVTEKKTVQANKSKKETDKPVEKETKETVTEDTTSETKKSEKAQPETSKEKTEKAEEKNKKEAEESKEKVEEVKQEKKEEEQKPVAKEAKTAAGTHATVKEVKSEPKLQSSTSNKPPLAKTPPSGTAGSTTRRTGQYTARTAVPPKEPKKKTNIWLWVIIILIVNGIIITYFIMSDQLSGLFKKNEEVPTPDYYDMTIDENEEQTDDMLIVEPEEQIIDEEPVSSPEKPVTQPAITGKRYYVVAGVFREEQNADNLVIELRNQGYNAEKFCKIGNLHAVSFGVYTSRSEAEREMQRIKKEENPEAWIKVLQ